MPLQEKRLIDSLPLDTSALTSDSYLLNNLSSQQTNRRSEFETEINGFIASISASYCRRPLLKLMKHLLCALLPLAFSNQLLQADFTAAAVPGSSQLIVLEDAAPYLSFDYYDWGPNWSAVERDSDSIEVEGAEKFTYRNTLRETGVSFTIEGSWSQSEDKVLDFEASLLAEGTSPLVMAQFSIRPGAAFDGQTALVLQDDGSTTKHPLPFSRGSLGEAVRRITLRDQAGRETLFNFKDPADISVDGNLRLVIARDQIHPEQKNSLQFEVRLPDTLEFIPGVKAARAHTHMGNWFTFNPPSPLPADSEWTMADWLEAPAGKHGRIRRQGAQLIYNGEPFKLWGLNNSFAACAPENDLADKRAQFYADMGVNSVRFHKYADGTGWAGILTKDSAVEFDPEKLDQMDYFVNALKEKGIYTKLSPVFIMDIGPADRERVPYMDELGSMRGNRINPRHGSFYLSTELQDLLIDQVTKLLEHTNPYTGMRYADDPAIAYFELYNEDSALFGGVSNVMARSPTLRQRGGAMFAAWLKEKYLNKDAWLTAWGDQAINNAMVKNQKLPLDESWEENRIYPAGNPWFFDPDNLNTSQKAFRRRLLDTMAFLYELQNQVYARYAQAIRDTGYDGELITSNWQAGRMMSHFYNLHSDFVGGTIDRHNYFGGGARGLGAFNSVSMLNRPGGEMLSSSLQMVEGAPFMLSEWIHVLPNEWGVEGAAILGAYGMGLQGWDVSYAFQNADDGTFSSFIGRHPWDVTAPQFMGIFPAVSRQVLRGDVKESEIVHYRNVHIPSLDSMQIGFNEKVEQNWDMKTFTSDVFPAEAIAAAKGLVRFTDEFVPTEPFDLAAYTTASGAIKSSSSQLLWMPGDKAIDGHIIVDTPATQALIGFAEGKTIETQDASITPESRFGAIYLTALSPEGSLQTDEGILITAIARARNTGQVVINDSVLLSKGQGPVMMEPVRANIDIDRNGSPTLHILDHGGAKTGRTLPVTDGKIEIDTARDGSPYYLLEF